MTAPFAKLNGWGKVLTVAVPLALAAFIAIVTMRADVRHAEESLRDKADRREVEAVLREVQAARQDIAELRQLVMRREGR